MSEVAAKYRINTLPGWTVYCFIWRGKTKQKRHAIVSAKTKAAAITRMKLNYPPPKYFGWDCDNSDMAGIANKTR